MCKSTEVTVTGVFHHASGSWDLWLTETDDRGQVELLGNAAHASDALVNLLQSLRNALMQSHFIGDLETNRG